MTPLTASTTCEAFHYILTKIGKTSKIKLVKLIYLADKYHLLRYGRTITGDDYYAMQYGPVGTTAKDLLSLDNNSSEPIEKVGPYEYKIKNSIAVTYEMLSETDKEALDFVISRFGNMDQWELMEYTHKYPEWKQHEDLLKNGLNKRELIDTIELFSTINNDLLEVPEELFESSKEIFTGKI